MPIVRTSQAGRPWPTEHRQQLDQGLLDLLETRPPKRAAHGAVRAFVPIKEPTKDVEAGTPVRLREVAGATIMKRARRDEVIKVIEVPVHVSPPPSPSRHVRLYAQSSPPLVARQDVRRPALSPPRPHQAHSPQTPPILFERTRHTASPVKQLLPLVAHTETLISPRKSEPLHEHAPPSLCVFPQPPEPIPEPPSSAPLFTKSDTISVSPAQAQEQTPPLLFTQRNELVVKKETARLLHRSEHMAVPRSQEVPGDTRGEVQLVQSSKMLSVPKEHTETTLVPSMHVLQVPQEERKVVLLHTSNMMTSPRGRGSDTEEQDVRLVQGSEQLLVPREQREVVLAFSTNTLSVPSEQREVALMHSAHSMSVPRERNEVALIIDTHTLSVPRGRNEVALVPDMRTIHVPCERREVALVPEAHTFSVPRERREVTLAHSAHTLSAQRETCEVTLQPSSNTVSVPRARAALTQSLSVQTESQEVTLVHSTDVSSVPRKRDDIQLVQNEALLQVPETRKAVERVHKEECLLEEREDTLSVPRERDPPNQEVLLYAREFEMSIEREQPTRSSTPVELLSHASSVINVGHMAGRLSYDLESREGTEDVPDSPAGVVHAVRTPESRVTFDDNIDEHVYNPANMTGLGLRGSKRNRFAERLLPYLVPRKNCYIDVKGREEEVIDMCCRRDGVEEGLVEAALEVISEARGMEGVCALKAKAGLMRGLGLQVAVEDPPMFTDVECAMVLAGLWQLDFPPGQTEQFKQTLRDILQLLLPYLQQEPKVSGRYISPARSRGQDIMNSSILDNRKISPPRASRSTEYATPSLLRFPSPTKGAPPTTPQELKYISPPHNRPGRSSTAY